jgi:hypothetical protein
MKTPRRLEALEQRRSRFRDGLPMTTDTDNPTRKSNQSISGKQRGFPKNRERKAHLDGFVWHTRHTTRVSLRERKKGNCQLGFHLLCVWRGGRGCGREGTNDTRECAERNERCIRFYIRDDRI